MKTCPALNIFPIIDMAVEKTIVAESDPVNGKGLDFSAIDQEPGLVDATGTGIVIEKVIGLDGNANFTATCNGSGGIQPVTCAIQYRSIFPGSIFKLDMGLAAEGIKLHGGDAGGRQVFGPLSVEDNLKLGGRLQPKQQAAQDLERISQLLGGRGV